MSVDGWHLVGIFNLTVDVLRSVYPYSLAIFTPRTWNAMPFSFFSSFAWSAIVAVSVVLSFIVLQSSDLCKFACCKCLYVGSLLCPAWLSSTLLFCCHCLLLQCHLQCHPLHLFFTSVECTLLTCLCHMHDLPLFHDYNDTMGSAGLPCRHLSSPWWAGGLIIVWP